jgi:glycosyltransferase involved in cell wall biosynthesis
MYPFLAGATGRHFTWRVLFRGVTPNPEPVQLMRDAILFSGWVWETFNVPERFALALAHTGVKVLYCENPVSRFFRTGRKLEEVFPGVHAYGPEFLGHRLNAIPGMVYFQCRMLAAEVASLSTSLGLRDPLFVYPHLKNFTPLCRLMKHRGFPLVHLCIDYPEPYQEEQIALADRCLVIPPGVFRELRERHGDKVSLIEQLYYAGEDAAMGPSSDIARDLLHTIPHPRLAYLGPASNRLDLPLTKELLREHPEWQLITFGGDRCVSLPNVHALPWINWQEIPAIVRSCDVGFMPYERTTQKNLQCVPLKLFDYFAAGLPVVSTPISYVQVMNGLVYVGDSASSLAIAVRQALAEPPNSLAKERRKQIAQAHSIEVISAELGRIAGLD